MAHAHRKILVSRLRSFSGVSGVPGVGFWSPTAAEFEHVPIENVVVGESLAMEQVAEQLAEVAEIEKYF